MPITWPLTREDVRELSDKYIGVVDRLDFEGVILSSIWVLQAILGTEDTALAMDAGEVFCRLVLELPDWHPLHERLMAMHEELLTESIQDPPPGLEDRLQQLSDDFMAYLSQENERWHRKHPSDYRTGDLWSREVLNSTLNPKYKF